MVVPGQILLVGTMHCAVSALITVPPQCESNTEILGAKPNPAMNDSNSTGVLRHLAHGRLRKYKSREVM